MKTHFKSMKTMIRFATVLALFASFAGPVSAQNGKNKGNSGSGKQAISQSSTKSNQPRVNKSDKTLRQGKSISAGPGPMPTVDRDDKYRRRGTFVQNGANRSAHGGAGMPPSNMLNKSTAGDSRSIYPTEVQRPGIATGDFNRDGLDDLVQTSKRVQTPKRDFGDRAVKWMGPEFDALANPSGQSLTGQDQETGEIITYPNATNFKRRK